MNKQCIKKLLLKLCILICCIIMFGGCFFLNIFKPTPDEELPIEEWKVTEVKYYPNLNYLTVYIDGESMQNSISEYEYYKDYELTENIDFCDYIKIDDRSLTFAYYDSGYNYNVISFSFVTPPLDSVQDVGIEVVFDTETFFYKQWAESWGGISPDAKCRFATEKIGITFYE